MGTASTSDRESKEQGFDHGHKRSMEDCFVHLHTHSAYSLLEGAIPLDRLLELAISDQQPALAITDRNNLFCALEFSEKAQKQGLQPIHGCMLSVSFDAIEGESDQVSPVDSAPGSSQSGGLPGSRDELRAMAGRSNGQSGLQSDKHGFDLTHDSNRAYLVLLAQNQTGYDNLTKLVSRAHLQGELGDPPQIKFSQICALNEGLIVLSGGPEGPLNALLAQGRPEQARQLVQVMKTQFGDRFYIELQRHEHMPRNIERQLYEFAVTFEIPVVATNQVYFATPDDHQAHDALICIAEGSVVGQDDRRHIAPQLYFKTADQMRKLFADIPEAIHNTAIIAQRCHYGVAKRKPILPNYAEDQGNSSEIAVLTSAAKTGLQERLQHHGLAEGFSESDYEARLEFELSIIREMGFPGYFLIVADFINWAKDHDIPVGPGRGSGAASVVAWSLKITDLDPLKFGLLFERFLNPERLSMPDFDVDFCQERREEVIHYVRDKYGADRVAQIITFGSLQARAVLRDVGRVLQMSYNHVDRLCKLIPADPANPTTLAQAVANEPKLAQAREEEEVVDLLFNIAMRLEGLFRHASTHAAGLVIGDRPLEQLVPLYRDPRSDMPVSQFNMKWVESAGLVKFDFLGLKTLTVIRHTIRMIAQSGKDVDIDKIPLEDEPTYQMLAQGDTIGVFQLESAGMRKALIGMKPDRFEDIIALVALYRPGPMDNIPTYNARKNGEEEPDYYHDNIKGILQETYGVIIYQEQVLQIAQILSGYTLGEADFLRKAMGKKIKSEMDAQRIRFVDGATERGLTKDHANMIFDVLAKFAGYGFNKAHAAAYALVSYQTAWLKCHYPVEFLAANMQLDSSNTDKLAVFFDAAKQMGHPVSAPSVQTSKASFSVNEGTIRYALAAIKGVGEGAVEHLVREREENGPFSTVTDFVSRVDPSHFNKKTLEGLILAGALDCFGYSRESLLGATDRLLGHTHKVGQDRKTGQSDMFGGKESADIIIPQVTPWAVGEKLAHEHSALGFYMSAHPLDEFGDLLEKLRVQKYADFESAAKSGASAAKLAGTLVTKNERKTRMGKSMANLVFSDQSGQFEAVIFEEALGLYSESLQVGASLLLGVGADFRNDEFSLRIQSVRSLAEEANRKRQDLRIFVRDSKPCENIRTMIGSTCKASRDGSRMSIILIKGDSNEEIEIETRQRFSLNQKVVNAIMGLPGVVEAEWV